MQLHLTKKVGSHCLTAYNNVSFETKINFACTKKLLQSQIPSFVNLDLFLCVCVCFFFIYLELTTILMLKTAVNTAKDTIHPLES